MKSFQQNLLIALAFALCCLCAWQWRFQTVQRQHLGDREQVIYRQGTAIRNYTNSIDKLNQQINRMDTTIAGLNTNLEVALKTNHDFIIQQRREIARLGSSNDFLLLELIQCTNDVATLQSNLDTDYAGIKKQNAIVEELVTNRDYFVQKYTNTVTLYNDLVGKYTNLVERFNRLQSSTTNVPPK